jgi:serine/threonine kinase PknH
MSSRQPDPDDEDTGPLDVDHLRVPSAGAAEPRFDAPLSVNPRPVHRNRRPVALIVAATVAVVGLGVLAWAFWPSSDGGQDSADAATTTAETETPEQAQSRLLGMVPRGYPQGACEPVAPTKGALAQVSCARNDDPGGPLTATYTLAADAESLKALFDGVIRSSSVVNCPGNIQSPVHCPTGVSSAFGDSGR